MTPTVLYCTVVECRRDLQFQISESRASPMQSIAPRCRLSMNRFPRASILLTRCACGQRLHPSDASFGFSSFTTEMGERARMMPGAKCTKLYLAPRSASPLPKPPHVCRYNSLCPSHWGHIMAIFIFHRLRWPSGVITTKVQVIMYGVAIYPCIQALFPCRPRYLVPASCTCISLQLGRVTLAWHPGQVLAKPREVGVLA